MRKKKKAGKFKIAFVLFSCLIFSIIVVYFLVRKFYPTSFAHYPGFEIYMPTQYSMHGIDVSRYQKTINWEQVKEMEANRIKLRFAFMKATQGTGLVDPQFRRNWEHAQKAGLPRGAYHYFVPGRNAEAQAKNFLRIAKLEKGDLPPVLDVEELNGVSPQELQAGVQIWLDRVEAAYNVKPIIYSSAGFYTHYLGKKFDAYPLWVAHYLQKKKPRIERDWVFWQHSETGRVNGIDAAVDFNVFFGDSTDFENFKIK